MYARVNVVQAGQSQPSSSGRWSRAKRALRMFSRPSHVIALPVRAVRVGSTQSNMSTPGLDHLEDALGVADSHEVARLFRRAAARVTQSVVSNIERAVLADREAADRVAVEVELEQLLDAAAAELGVGAALVDREAELARRALGVRAGARAHSVVRLTAS